MARQSTYHLYDRLLGGRLRDLLAAWHAEGLPLAEISFRLREQNVQASTETVRRWLRDLGITEPVAS